MSITPQKKNQTSKNKNLQISPFRHDVGFLQSQARCPAEGGLCCHFALSAGAGAGWAAPWGRRAAGPDPALGSPSYPPRPHAPWQHRLMVSAHSLGGLICFIEFSDSQINTHNHAQQK